jgi:hypothetical protein
LIFASAPAAYAQATAPKAGAQTTAPKAGTQTTAPKAGAQATAPKNDGGRCVGVVSAIGDTFTAKKVGIVVFQNEVNKIPIESWHMDDVAAGKIMAVVGKGLNLKRVDYPKGAFGSLDEDHGLFYNREEELTGILRRVTASTKCDQYIVVLKTSVSLANSNQGIGGLGIFHGAGIVSSYHLHALLLIRLYDGQNFSVVKQQKASIGHNFFSAIQGPSREVDETWWPTSPATSPKLRDGMRALVEKSVEMTLPQLLGN